MGEVPRSARDDESAGGLAHSKSLRTFVASSNSRSVLECGHAIARPLLPPCAVEDARAATTVRPGSTIPTTKTSFVMSSEVETSLTVRLQKIRDSSTALGMTRKRSRQTNLLCGGGFAALSTLRRALARRVPTRKLTDGRTTQSAASRSS
jgi:hypothetical protein